MINPKHWNFLRYRNIHKTTRPGPQEILQWNLSLAYVGKEVNIQQVLSDMNIQGIEIL